MTWWVIGAVVYVVCGVIAYGLVFHYFQERFKCFGWPRRWAHRIPAIAAAILGPIGLFHRWVLGLDDEGKTAWRLRYRGVSAEESWNDFHRRWPNLPKTKWQRP